jgi:hypothetical protein
MTLRFSALLALVLVPSGLLSQEPSACPNRVSIPGGSNPGDAPVHRCRLTNRPSLRTPLDDFPAPMYAQAVGSDATVIVKANGHIDEKFTRFWLLSGDDEYHEQFMAALRKAQFDVGTLGSSPSRYGFRLIVQTDVRTDTIPQKLIWRYVRGEIRDSLIGQWQRTAREPSHTPAQVADIVGQVTKTLRHMQVLLPTQEYCVIADGDSSRYAVAQELPVRRGRLAPLSRRTATVACETDVSRRRYRIERPIRTGGGRTVVHASGDLLRNWPPGLDGRLWLAWEAYCVVPDSGPLVGRPQCRVGPLYTGDPGIDGWAPPMFTDTSQKAPLQIAVEVTTGGSYWIDTIKAPVPGVPRLQERAAMLYDVNLCDRSEGWTMIADSVTGKEQVAWLKLSGDTVVPHSMRVDSVRKRPPNHHFRGCDGSPSRISIAAFLLGTLGDPPVSPVEFCHNMSACRQRIVIDPAKHMLAARPVLSFKFSELRPEAMIGEQYHLRLHTNRDAEGLIPFIVLRHKSGTEAYVLRRRSARQYDFRVMHTPPFPKETVVDVYVATAGHREVLVPR